MDDFTKKCKIECNDTFGRYVVAAMDLKAGETILLEQPLLILAFNGDHRCSNCFKLTTKFCSTCYVFSLCDDCALHNEEDCKFFANLKDLRAELLQRNSLLSALLKCLLMRESASLRIYYDQLLQMEAHMEKRRDTDIWKEHQKFSVDPMLNCGLLPHLQDGKSIDSELLQRICGIIDINCFELRAPDRGEMRGVYPRAALLAHSCVANTNAAIDDQYRLKLYTTRDVAKGHMLCYCYTNVLVGTAERHDLLKAGKHFECDCERCEDPTELGSHLSSLVCPRCAEDQREGYVVKKRDKATKESSLAVWKCQLCEHTLTATQVQALLECTKEEIFHAKDDITRYELLLAKLKRYFHTNHYLLLDIKQNIAAILRSIIQNIVLQPGRRVYERKVALCKEIAYVLNIIQPGISRLKAIVLYELANTSSELYRMRYGEKELDKTELAELLQQVELMLRESIRMLLYEPLETSEGQMVKGMLKELKELQDDIQYLEQNEEISTLTNSA